MKDTMQDTMEEESTSGTLAFLDILITNNRSSKYNFTIFIKAEITNIMIKPNSAIDPSISPGVFKGFLARALRICSDEHLKDEINFLCDVFVENGYNREKLNNIVQWYVNKNMKTCESTIVNIEHRKSQQRPSTH